MKHDFGANPLRPFSPFPVPLGEPLTGAEKAKLARSVNAHGNAPKTPLGTRGGEDVKACGHTRAAHATGAEAVPCAVVGGTTAEPPPFPKDYAQRRHPTPRAERGTGGLCIVIDTREQTPLSFPDGVKTKRGTLHTGDYSIEGFEDAFTVERKSIADAVGTVIHDRARFVRELERMGDFAFRRILITSPFARVAAGHYAHSRANPNSVIGLLCALEIRYGVPVVFAADAAEAARRVVDWARHFVREQARTDAAGPSPTPPALGSFQPTSPQNPKRRGGAHGAIPPRIGGAAGNSTGGEGPQKAKGRNGRGEETDERNC